MSLNLKDRISSPLEAGVSVLDAHHLPPHLIPALEYTSDRLAKKAMHITLVVVRRDYQLPPIVTPLSSPLSSPRTPASPRFNFSNGPVTALKQLVRSGASYNGPASRVGMTSPVFAPSMLDTSSPRMRWPLTPSTPMSPPPMTPCTASTISTIDSMSSAMSTGTFGMRLVHASRLPQKREKVLKSTLEKAEKRFHVGTEWLSPSVSPAECGLSNHLINTSIIQNEILFSGEGLTLLSLDRLYSLKSALSSYSKTGSHLRLEDAVDELRRIILANNGQKVTKADLLRSYDWLSVSNSALVDLDRMYRRAYGGSEQFGGIAGMATFVEPIIKTPSVYESDFEEDLMFERFETTKPEIGIAVPMKPMSKPSTPTPKGLALRIQTSFENIPKKVEAVKDTEDKNEDEDEDEEHTARPIDQPLAIVQPWNINSTIGQALSAGLPSPGLPSPGLLSPDRSTRIGPITPIEYGDFSPVTRGEWNFLMIDDAFKGGRTVAVETF